MSNLFLLSVERNDKQYQFEITQLKLGNKLIGIISLISYPKMNILIWAIKLIEIVLRSQACNLLWSLRSLTDSFREAAGTTGKDKFIYFSWANINSMGPRDAYCRGRLMTPVMGNSDVLSDIETVFKVLNWFEYSLHPFNWQIDMCS